ncbi:MAG: right-handed parallel beta-helix repeat-containing protein [Phycisphaerales bacterium]
MKNKEDFVNLSGWNKVMSNKIIISLALTLLLTTFTNAANIYVPDDHATIQAAVTAASEGDRIFVRPGTYAGNIDFGDVKKNLYIRSLDLNPLTCTIECAGTRGFYLHANETESTVIEGFTITGGNAGANTYGGAFELDGASPTIKKCIIKDSTATYGGAIDIYYGSPLFLNCVITNNTASYDGSAVECSGDSSPVFKNCLIYENKNTFGYGSLDFYDGAFAEFENCTIADNTGVNGLGGIVSDESEITVINSILWNNGTSVSGTTVTINNSCVERGYEGIGIISSDPLFKKGYLSNYLGNYYLSQVSAGQVKDSNCINAGDCNYAPTSVYASDPNFITSTYNINDTGKVDLGFHYPKAGTPKEFTLKTSVSNQNHGQIKPNDPLGLIKYKQYGEVVVEANAVPGYRFSEFAYGNAAANPSTYTFDSNNPLTVTMDYNTVVIAGFNSNLMYKLTTYVKSGSGSVSVVPNTYPTEDPCTFDIPENVDPVITATPATTGWVIKNWYKSDANDPNILILEPNSVGKTTYTVTNMNANTTVAVEFEWREYDLVTSVVGGNGNIAPKRGRYPAGTIVDLTATPDTGYRISAWTGCDVVPAWNTPTNTVLMNSNKTVSVQFQQNLSKVIHVYGDVGGIQDAFNQAAAGDTIKIHPGTYSGTGFHIDAPGVTILGDPEHPENVVIDWQYDTAHYFINGIELGSALQPNLQTITLNGLTLKNLQSNSNQPAGELHPGDNGPDGRDNHWGAIGIYGNHKVLNCIIQNITLTSSAAYNGVAGGDPNFGEDPNGGSGGQGGFVGGGGISIFNGSPEIKNVLIEGCNVYGGDGGHGAMGFYENEPNNTNPEKPQFGPGFPGKGGQGGAALGGGIFVTGGASPKFIDVTVRNCNAYAGDGGSGADAVTILDPCDIDPTIVPTGDPAALDGADGNLPGMASGGGVFCDAGTTPQFINSHFENCKAYGGTGGNGGNGSSIEGTNGSGGYGGLCTQPGSGQGDLRLFTGNGGGVFCDVTSNPIFTNCSFSDNMVFGSKSGVGGLRSGIERWHPWETKIVPANGAGIMCFGTTKSTFENCNFNNNRTSFLSDLTDPNAFGQYDGEYTGIGGGLCLFYTGAIDINDCNFTSNQAPIGGGIYGIAASNTVLIKNSNISDNISYSGAGIMMLDSNSIIENSIIKNNAAGTRLSSNDDIGYALYGAGGGVYMLSSMCDIHDCDIAENSAMLTGGGICIDGDFSRNNIFYTPVIKNNLITKNTAGQEGGGIAAITFAEPSIQNCTIVENAATGAEGMGGGVFASYSAKVSLSDNIIWKNTGVAGSQIALSSGGQPASVKVAFSDIDLREKAGFADISGTPQVPTATANRLIDSQKIYNDINTKGSAHVIVNLSALDFTTDWSSEASISVMRNAVAYRQTQVLSGLNASDFTVEYKMENAPIFTGNVTASGLTKLMNSQYVANIEPVRIAHAMLAQAIPMGNALQTRATYNGQGCSIAIVDTGVDYSHPRLGGGRGGFPNSKVIGGYDFGDNDADPMPAEGTVYPDGYGTGAHGTNCAGIAAGMLGTVGDYIGGVAYNSKIAALKVTRNDDPGQGFANSATLAAWDWCITHKKDDPQNPILVISNSWAIYNYPVASEEEADVLSPSHTELAATAVAAGITVLGGSGNDGFAGEGISWPSAMSNVISVGAVYDTSGEVTDYSNTANNLDILAPADPVYTTDIMGDVGYDGDYYPNFNGTSSACPFAAGCVASLQSASAAMTGGWLSPSQIEVILKATGTAVTDSKVAVTKPMVNLGSAISFISSSTPIYVDDPRCSLTGIAKDTSGKWTVQGSSNISRDPNFVLGYYLSNKEAGQPITSVCVDAGSVLSGNLGMDKYTTRTDGVVDKAGSLVDMGYHYQKGLKIYNLVIDTNTIAAGGTTDPAPGTYKKYSNDVVQIKAIPDANSRVREWIIDGVPVRTNQRTRNVTMNREHHVTVVFEPHFARSIVVPDQYQTIQEAIDASESGDTIFIYPNINGKPHYISDPCGFDLQGKAITIRSRFPDDPNYVANAIIDCSNKGRAFIFHNNEGPNTIIEGLTIVNGLSAVVSEGTEYRQNPVDGNDYTNEGIDATGDGFGGAIHVGSLSGPTIRKCVFKNCQATGGQGSDGGIGYNLYSNDNRTSLVQAGRGGSGGNGSGDGFGGVIFCDERSYPKILDCIFTDNAAKGGIGGNGGDGGDSYGGKIGGNGGNGGDGTGNGYGGAIYCSFESIVTINGCKFSGNIGGTGIGGIGGLKGVGATPTQPPYPDDGQVGSGSGTGLGGAIYYEEKASADINNCQLLDNRALSVRNDSGSGGGAIYFEPKCSYLKIKDSTIAGNDAAAGTGGAILINSGNKLDLNNCYIGGNNALLNGGGIAVGSRVDANTTKLLFNDCVFTSNKSQGIGGGIFAKNADANFIECYFNRNEAYSGGGLNFVSKSKLRIVGGTISDNNAFGSEGEGGGVSVQFVPAEFINVQFIGNNSNYAAGAIMFNGIDTRGSKVLNCLFAKNKARARGGAVVASLDSNPEFKCCTFSENEVDIGGHGGAIFCTFRSSPSIMYCIFDKNKRVAIYENSDDCHTYIQRNFFNANYHGDYFKYDIEKLFDTLKVDSDIQDMNDYTAGHNRFTGKVEADEEPIFRTGALGGYYLRQKNQDFNDLDILAVDAGDIDSNIPMLPLPHPMDVMAHYTTRTDSNRPGNVPCTKDQGLLDWGFHYKHIDEAHKLWLTTYVISGRGTLEPVATDPCGYPAYMGTTVRLVAKPETGWRVRQWVGSDDDSSISTTNYVVMMNNRTVGIIFEQPKNLYLPAEFTTLQDAINASRSGDKIVVSQGTYQFAGTNFDNYGVTIHGKNITITSTNPDDPCVVANTVFNQSRFNISSVDSSMILEGITIANARYYVKDRICPSVPLGPDGYNGGDMFGGGMIITNASPIIRNVRFVNCFAGGGDASNNCGTGGDGGWGGYGRGGAVGIDVGSSPVFKNCQFIDCFAEGGDGGNGDQSDQTPGHGGSWGDPNKYVNHTWDHADGRGENGGYKPYWFYSGYGGAVYCANSTSASFEKCQFSGNNAIGGACGLSAPVTWDTWPVHNYAIDSFGGAVYLEAGSNARFTDCNFVNNTADTRRQIGDINFPYEVAGWVLSDPVVSYGGAICAENAAAIPFIKNCNFNGNTACAGGGVYVEDSPTRFADSKFTGNRAMIGGAMLFIDSNSAVSECDFTGNNAFAPAGQGGAIYSASSSTEFYDCQMMYNNAAVSGGAAYFGGENEPNMFNCLIAGNTANRDGGGISANWDVQLFMSLCTVANNDVSGGGFAAGFGGGLSCAYEANVKIINSIFWDNNAEYGNEISIGSTFDSADKRKAEVTVTYSNIQGGASGVFYDQASGCEIYKLEEPVTNLPPTTASDPNFMTKIGWGSYFLGSNDVNDPPLQPLDHNNPNVDAGANLAFAYHMYKHTTRTDLALDVTDSNVDLGYHYTRVATIKGDFNFDGKVNFDDFRLFFMDPYWMSQDCQFPYYCDGRDFTEDGEVDFEDFAVFAENYQGNEKTPPTPNPMMWEIGPRSISPTSIKMIAKEARDNSGSQVYYQFECTTHPALIPKTWEPNTVCIVSGLTTGVNYGFHVRAKDDYNNVTGWSKIESVKAGEDGTAPKPDPMTFAIPPALKSEGGQISITMKASTATDIAGVEYYFDEITGRSGGSDSSWLSNTDYEDFNLEPNTIYGYRVKARDKSQSHNETGYSQVVFVHTPTQNTTDPNITDTNAPSPVEWAYGPTVYDSGTYYFHTMAATPATDASGEVWYYFEAVEGSEKTNSDWIDVPYWEAGGFWGVNHCSYRFKLKDKFDNESVWSPIRSTY